MIFQNFEVLASPTRLEGWGHWKAKVATVSLHKYLYFKNLKNIFAISDHINAKPLKFPNFSMFQICQYNLSFRLKIFNVNEKVPKNF